MNSKTRRAFLVSNAAAATALIAGRKIDAAERTRKRMTLGFSTYGMKSLTTERAIDVLAEIGYDAVEITVWPGWDAEPKNVPAVRRKSLRDQMQKRNLVLTSLMEHIYPSADNAEHKQQLERLKSVFKLASDLAGNDRPVVQTVLGGGKFSEKKNLFVDRVGDWIELGKQAGIVTCIKPHRGGAMSRPAEGIAIIRELGESPWLKIVYDYSHYAFRDIPLLDSVKQAVPHTAHVAVKDAVQKDGRVRFDLPGAAGTVDFVTILKTLNQAGYTGDISCEVSGMVWSKTEYDPVAAAKTCYKNMAAAFDKAGIRRS